jgi:alpha-tubulin suppressor-like RCC1 family protein
VPSQGRRYPARHYYPRAHDEPGRYHCLLHRRPEVSTTLSAWGNNYFGQLGDGTYGNNRTTPAEVSDLHGAEVEAIAGGQGHTLALKSDGTVLAWGYNQDGELGDGKTKTDSPKPVRASDLKGFRAIEGGGWFSLALKEDGTVWAWGANDQGQLGNGSKTLGGNTLGINSPAKVKDLAGVKVIAAGLDFSLAGK